MMKSDATTVASYLASLPEERRKVISKVRSVIRKALPRGYEEAMNYGMIAWQVPLKRYANTYNKQPLAYALLAAQKNNYVLHLPSVYGDPALDRWWRERYQATGKRLDMGKGCVRFKRLEDLPLALVGECISKVTPEAFIARYEAVKGPAGKRKA